MNYSRCAKCTAILALACFVQISKICAQSVSGAQPPLQTRPPAQRAPTAAGRVTFGPGVGLPTIPASLPVYQLETDKESVQRLQSAMKELLAASGVKLQFVEELSPQQTTVWVAREAGTEKTVRAWLDLGTGEAQIYPQLKSDKKFPSLEVANLVGKVAPEQLRLLVPRDDSRARVGTFNVLQHTRVKLSDAGVPPRSIPVDTELLYVTAQRFVSGTTANGSPNAAIPVGGLGSRALVVLDGNGVVRGLSRRWKSVASQTVVKAELKPST
ncbi:MAG: hypothetical protein RL701_7873, partial [Pseudomonadota bacterium]